MLTSLLLALLYRAPVGDVAYIARDSASSETNSRVSAAKKVSLENRYGGSKKELSQSIDTLRMNNKTNISDVLLSTSTKEDRSNAIEMNSSVKGSLANGDSVVEADGSLYDTYEIELTAGKVYQFLLESSDFDTYLLLSDGSDQIIAENDDVVLEEVSGFSIENSELIISPAVSGTYLILANGYDADSVGGYQLSTREFSAQEVVEMNDAEEAYQIGNEHILLGQFTLAAEQLEKALALSSKLNIHLYEAKAFIRTLGLYGFKGFINRFVNLNHKYADKYPLSGSEESFPARLMTISGYLNKQQYKSAVEYFENLPKGDSYPNTQIMIKVALPLMITRAYTALGEFDTAIANVTEVERLVQSLPASKQKEELRLAVDMSMGTILYMKGDSAQALSYSQNILAALRKNPSYFYGSGSESSSMSYIAALSANDLRKIRTSLTTCSKCHRFC